MKLSSISCTAITFAALTCSVTAVPYPLLSDLGGSHLFARAQKFTPPPGGAPVMSVPARSVFQPREGDLCTWVDENKFFKLDDEIQKEDFTLQDLLTAYNIVTAALHNANLHFAAVGGFALTILGGRKGANMTHDVDLIFNGSVTQLFDILRKTKGLRLKKGLQADNFRIHCQISGGRWVGVDLLARKPCITGHTTNRKGVIMLRITPLIATKLQIFHAHKASRDAEDIAFLVINFHKEVQKNDLDKDQVEFFLEDAELKSSVKEQMKRILA